MKTAYVFPGQGAQFPGMGKELLERYPEAQTFFDQSREILGFNIQEIMFDGSPEDLKQTQVTQPAVFIHSVLAFKYQHTIQPDMTAGHSLGEFSALVAAQCLDFSAALELVSQRAFAMQEACEINPSTMAAVLGLDDNKVADICASITDDIVVPANFNCPGQIVISGTHKGIERATEALKDAGAKRVLPLQVGGAFHSPLMSPAQEKLEKAILSTVFNTPVCPIYQNVDALPYTDPGAIKENLRKQLTGAVLWTNSIQNMVSDGAQAFIECGPGNVLQGLIKKIHKEAQTSGLS